MFTWGIVLLMCDGVHGCSCISWCVAVSDSCTLLLWCCCFSRTGTGLALYTVLLAVTPPRNSQISRQTDSHFLCKPLQNRSTVWSKDNTSGNLFTEIITWFYWQVAKSLWQHSSFFACRSLFHMVIYTLVCQQACIYVWCPRVSSWEGHFLLKHTFSLFLSSNFYFTHNIRECFLANWHFPFGIMWRTSEMSA